MKIFSRDVIVAGLITFIIDGRQPNYDTTYGVRRGYIYNLLRAASDLYPTGPPFNGLNFLVTPKRDL